MKKLSVLFLACLIGCVAAFAAEESKMFPFPVPTLDASKNITDLSYLNEKPAGKNGFVTVKDGHFIDGSGKRIRFFGTNLTFGACFPDHATAEKLAARLAKLGFNCVRFHHMDCHYAPRGIWDKKYKDKQHIDPEQLDRLDYLIYQLKRNGIYANINLHVSRKFTEADGFPDAKLLPKFDKGVDNFEARMIELQKKYAKDLLTHTNPYTKTRYVEEPAVAIVELNNENSLLQMAISGRLEPLPPYYAKQLDKLWNDYLKKYYISTESLSLAWKEVDEPLGRELLVNPDFSNGTEGWTFEINAPAKGSFEAVNEPTARSKKALHVRATKPGKVSWSFQVHQVHLDLRDGVPYTVSFRIKADKERKVIFSCRLDHAPWTGLGLRVPIAVGTEWKRYEFVFRPSGCAPRGNRITFTLPNDPGEYWIADVSLRRGGYVGLPKGQTLEKGNVQRPTPHGSKAAWRDYILFLMETEQRYATEMYRYLKDELKLRANVIDTQVSYGGAGGIQRESLMDFVDCHAYWEHPRFPGRPWDPGNWFIPNTSMVRKPSSSTLVRLSSYRVEGKPYTISEYNHPAPNDFQAECVPMLASFAAHQDWDGIFLFCYRNNAEEWERDYIRGYFAIDSNPSKIMMLPAGAMLFRRGDVSPANEQISLILPEEKIPDEILKYSNNILGSWEEAGTPPVTSIAKRLAVKLEKGRGKVRTHKPFQEITGLIDIMAFIFSPVLPQAEPAGLYRSDTGQIVWDVRNQDTATYIVDTARSKVAVGFIAGRTVELHGLKMRVAEREFAGFPDRGKFAAITLTSMDGKPIHESGRLLLCAVGRVENTGMKWDDERKTVGRNWGKGPVIAEGIPANIEIQTTLKSAAVYALDPKGNRKKQVPARVESGRVTLEIKADYETLWYEIELR